MDVQHFAVTQEADLCDLVKPGQRLAEINLRAIRIDV
jgi:hypothetical protein